MKIYKISQNVEEKYKDIEFNILETFCVGPYKLHLIEAVKDSFQEQMLNMFNLPKKQISMERNDTDATSLEQQMNKRPFEKDQPVKKTTNDLINKIKEWKDKYGEICVASFNNQKLVQYERIFKKLNVPHKKISKEIGQPFAQSLDFIII